MPASLERSFHSSFSGNTLQQSIHSTLQISMGNLELGITSGVRFSNKLEPQMHPTLQWLDSPNRPMRYYGGPVNLMSFLQQAYFSEEKINLIYVATLGIPTDPLHRRTSRSTGKRR